MSGGQISERDSSRQAWLRLAACASSAALLQIDGTIITVALPSVKAELGVGTHTVAWVLTAYFIAYGVALFPGGKLVDIYGSRRLAASGLVLFAVGALIGALAGSFALLIGSRVIQGLGAGLVSPASLAGAISGFPSERRGSALGIWGAVSGMANLIGPLLGGTLVVLGGWRACWWALLPMSAAALYGIWRNVPLRVQANELPEVGQLRQRVIGAAALTAALTFLVMIGTFFLAQQYLQDVVGYSGLAAGGALVIVAVLVGVAAPLAGRLSDSRGEPVTAGLGFVLVAIGLLVLGLPGAPLEGLAALPMLVAVGLGLGLLFTPASRAALNAVPMERHGRVSSVLSAARLLGAALGSALAGAAVSSGVTAQNVHQALLVAGAICLLIGLPVATQLKSQLKLTRAVSA